MLSKITFFGVSQWSLKTHWNYGGKTNLYNNFSIDSFSSATSTTFINDHICDLGVPVDWVNPLFTGISHAWKVKGLTKGWDNLNQDKRVDNKRIAGSRVLVRRSNIDWVISYHGHSYNWGKNMVAICNWDDNPKPKKNKVSAWAGEKSFVLVTEMSILDDRV